VIPSSILDDLGAVLQVTAATLLLWPSLYLVGSLTLAAQCAYLHTAASVVRFFNGECLVFLSIFGNVGSFDSFLLVNSLVGFCWGLMLHPTFYSSFPHFHHFSVALVIIVGDAIQSSMG
jgi:hypothetical protein